jgi:hypothetical protein
MSEFFSDGGVKQYLKEMKKKNALINYDDNCSRFHQIKIDS